MSQLDTRPWQKLQLPESSAADWHLFGLASALRADGSCSPTKPHMLLQQEWEDPFGIPNFGGGPDLEDGL